VDRRNILLCASLFLLAAAAINPVLEMGVHDDWSYTHIAREFTTTGHFVYNGWTAAMLLPQLVWAAVFIKLFGFSFFVVRLSTVVLAVLLIPVLYCLGRDSGLPPPFATFATLLTMLSPLAMLEAVSFMSDVPAFFLFVLCFCCAVKCWKAATPKDCARWAFLTALAGVLSGLDRQIYWLAPLTFLPAIACIRRRSVGLVRWLGVAWLAAIAAVGYAVLWFRAQPYTLTEHTLQAWKDVGPRFAICMTARMVLTVALVQLPLLAGYVAPGFKMVPRKTAALVFAGALAGGFCVSHLFQRGAPWMGIILTQHGILPPGTVAFGTRPVILGPAVRDCLTMALFLFCAGCGLALWRSWRAVDRRLSQDPAAPALVLGLVFAAVLLPALVYRSADMPAFDRYLIPLLPLAAIPLLRHYRLHVGASVSRWSWGLLALFALYGVATTHDAFSNARARLTAARALEQAGIPRTEIMAGFEYDGWTQLETAGYMNNRQIENPTGAYRRPAICTFPEAVFHTGAPMMTAIHGVYFVVLSRLPELEDSTAPPVGYTTWLPPAQRQVITQVLPGGRHAGCR
jgi:4-amino-4-deoxy-L-arabinose transferase-like glycosyltransferase